MRPRSGGDEGGVELDVLDAVDSVDAHAVRGPEARRAVDDPHPLALEQGHDVALEVALDALDARLEQLDVDLGLGLLESIRSGG